MHAFNSTTFEFIIFGKWNGAPLYVIAHVCMWLIVVFIYDKIRALLAQHCCQPLRWTNDLHMVTNLEYNLHMTVSRYNTSSSIDLLNSSLVDVVTCSPHCLFACNSSTMFSFSTINNLTLELVALAYDLVASTNAYGCFFTSDMIIRSSNCAGDTWTSRVGTLRDCRTLCCDLSKDMLCISTSGLSSRIYMSPWSLGTFSASKFGEAGGVTSQFWGMRSIS